MLTRFLCVLGVIMLAPVWIPIVVGGLALGALAVATWASILALLAAGLWLLDR